MMEVRSREFDSTELSQCCSPELKKKKSTMPDKSSKPTTLFHLGKSILTTILLKLLDVFGTIILLMFSLLMFSFLRSIQTKRA